MILLVDSEGPDLELRCPYMPEDIPVSILHKSTAARYRPVRVADGPTTARYRFIKNASWDVSAWRGPVIKTANINSSKKGPLS